MINMLTFEVDYLALTQSLWCVATCRCFSDVLHLLHQSKTSWADTMVMNEFGETGEGNGVDVLDVVVEDILTLVEEGAYDVMAVTEYVDYETEPDRYIREIEEAMQRLTVALKALKEYHAEYE